MRVLYVVLLMLCSIPCFSAINLSQFEKRVYSQNGEDGVLEKIFATIGTTDKYYVEFGTENGAQCNTRYFREFHGWSGLLMDGGYENLSINLHKEFITAENITDLFAKYQVPKEFDLLSIDIDYNDFYVWYAIGYRYRPRVVVIEYNATHLPSEDCVVQYYPTAMWDRTNYFGASLLAFFRLGQEMGYSLVHADAQGVNLFFIRDDVLKNLPDTFVNINEPALLYRPPNYGHGPNGGHTQDTLYRSYLTSSEVFKAFPRIITID
jgi:hypothetical protein